jgi:lysozyme
MPSLDEALLLKDLIHDEGKERFPYRDSMGFTTIGIGHNLSSKGLSDAIIYALYKEDKDAALGDLDHVVPWWRAMTEPRQRVLANMCFNMGIDKLMEFSKTLTAAQLGRYDVASSEMLDSLWAGQVGDRAVRLSTQMKEG